MKRIISSLMCAGLMTVGIQAIADDSPPSNSGSNATSTPSTIKVHKMMKDCMAKQRQANNGMSEEDMKKSCKDQIKAKVDNPDTGDSQPVVPAH
jgi:hypothetical protein